MEKTTHIRPHHVLCSQFFAKHGYNDEFTTHMDNILNELKETNATIEIVKHCDAICEHCPKNENGQCINESDVLQHDQLCMEEYSFSIGDHLSWSEISDHVLGKIKADGHLPSCCEGCFWSHICKSLQKK